MESTQKVNARTETWVAVLGRRDTPTDGIEDYCLFLGEALARHNVELRLERVPWYEKGWIGGLRSLSAESRKWGEAWVLLQHTALAWSRRGFPFGILFVSWILRRRGLRCAVVFHEPFCQSRERWIDRLRGRCQEWVIRRLYLSAGKAIFADPLEKIPWLSNRDAKAAFIPIGANIPETGPQDARAPSCNGNMKSVAVYCLSDPPHRQREIGDIADAMRTAAQDGIRARVVFVGRGTAEAKDAIERSFDSSSGAFVNMGLQSAADVRRILCQSDVMLCVRGPLYMRRGSAIAGLACGLPIVGYEGEAEGTPLSEAGVVLVSRNGTALGRALSGVLSDQMALNDLREKSRHAYDTYFCWSIVAEQWIEILRN